MIPRLSKIYRVLLSVIELYQVYQFFTFTICLKKASKLTPSFINVYQAQKVIVIVFYLSFGSNHQDLPSLKKQSPTKFKTFAMLFLRKKYNQVLSFTKFHHFLIRFLPSFTNIQRRAKRGIFFSPSFTPKTKFPTISTKFFQASQVLTKFYQQTNAREARRKILPSFTKIYQVLPSFTKFYQVYQVLPSFTKFYQVLPSFTKFYQVYQVLPSFTKFIKFYQVYQVLPSFTKFYQVYPKEVFLTLF